MRVHATVADKGDVVGLHGSWRGRLWLLDSERWGWHFNGKKERGVFSLLFPCWAIWAKERLKGEGGEEGTNVIERLRNSENHFHVCGNRTRRAGLRDERTRSQVSIQWGGDARAFSTIFLRICYIVQKELPASRLQYSSQYSKVDKRTRRFP